MFDGLYEALKSDAFQNLQRISRSTVVRPPPATRSGPFHRSTFRSIVSHFFSHGVEHMHTVCYCRISADPTTAALLRAHGPCKVWCQPLTSAR